MATVKLYNRARVGTATTGTGTITLGAAVTKYRTFATAGAVNGDTVHYVIEDGTAWEIGVGIYTSSGTTLSRSLITSSTGSLISLSGTAEVFIDAIAEYLSTTQSMGDNSTQLATTAYVDGATMPTMQVFTTGSGTYTKPANAKWLRIRMWGAGGGGSCSTINAGSNGGSTTFGSLTAAGGGGCASTIGSSGTGGTASGGNINIAGGVGTNSGTGGLTRNNGGAGGAAFGGQGTSYANADSASFAGTANSGAGGGGGSHQSTGSPGGGGGGGGYCEYLQQTPASTYSYAVGAGGAGGASSGSASQGSAGGSGLIIVEEHYRP